MKRIKKSIVAIYFQIGVNVIGLPEIHKVSFTIRQWTTQKGILILLLAFVACGKKPVATVQEKETNTTNVTNSDKELTAISLPVDDNIIIPISEPNTGNKNCDSLCRIELQRALSQISQLKRSGNNEYSVLYDRLKNQLEINVRLAETISSLKEIKKDSIAVREVKVSKEIPVKYVPPFWRYSAYIGWVAIALFIHWLLSKIKL